MALARFKTGWLASVLLATPLVAWADGKPSIRLAKTPDASDADKPATLAYQHNDGGKSDYVTEGAVKWDKDFGPNNDLLFSPAVSWNHNTLASTVTDNWSYSASVLQKLVVQQTNFLWFQGSIGEQRDATKSSNATTVKLGTTYFGWPEWKPVGTDELDVRPTITLFTKHVSQAKADAKTGVVPTGTMTGGLLALNAQVLLGRWTLRGTSQFLKTTEVVRGDTKGTHRLFSASIGYQLADPPTTGPEAKATPWIPGIALSRQSGDDPLNAIAKAKYTQVAFTLKY